MVLASLGDTMTGAAWGGALTAYASRNNNNVKDPVYNIARGAAVGAAFPSAIKFVHTVASKVFGFAFAQFKSGCNLISGLCNRGVTYASANPYVAGVAAVGLAVLLGAACLTGRQDGESGAVRTTI